jgi:hypothetical protein
MKSLGFSFCHHPEGNRDAADSACDCPVRFASIQESVRYCTRTESGKPRTSHEIGVFRMGWWGTPCEIGIPIGDARIVCGIDGGNPSLIAGGIGIILIQFSRFI